MIIAVCKTTNTQLTTAYTDKRIGLQTLSTREQKYSLYQLKLLDCTDIANQCIVLHSIPTSVKYHTNIINQHVVIHRLYQPAFSTTQTLSTSI